MPALQRTGNVDGGGAVLSGPSEWKGHSPAPSSGVSPVVDGEVSSLAGIERQLEYWRLVLELEEAMFVMHCKEEAVLEYLVEHGLGTEEDETRLAVLDMLISGNGVAKAEVRIDELRSEWLEHGAKT